MADQNFQSAMQNLANIRQMLRLPPSKKYSDDDLVTSPLMDLLGDLIEQNEGLRRELIEYKSLAGEQHFKINALEDQVKVLNLALEDLAQRRARE